MMALPMAGATLDVSVADAKGKGLHDAVIYAIPSKPLPMQRTVAVMDQKDRMFVPHILPVRTGTWVEFPNSDNIRHQVYSVSRARKFQLPLYIGKLAFPVQFPVAGVVAIGCNIHEQMSAYIVVVDTPHFAKTANGRASLAGLGAGDYTVRVWYEGMRDEPPPQSISVTEADQKSLSFVAK